MTDRYHASRRLLAHALAVTPGGSQTLSKRADRFPHDFPAFIERGTGALVWDVDGHQYIDWVCSLAAVNLGHGHPDVLAAASAQLAKGTLFSLPGALEVEAAEALAALVPCAEMVRFVKTGSEAAEAAIRVARRATGKDIILTSGYHSWHSWYMVTQEFRAGIPAFMGLGVRPFAEGALGDFGKQASSASNNVAAVFIEPTLVQPPPPGYLDALRRWCTDHGALLIFDEVVTGCRWAPGGYQEVCGVLPDLATFGKGIANGFPVAALVGPRRYMADADVISGTFGGELVSLAAMLATLNVHAGGAACRRIAEVGRELMAGFRGLAGTTAAIIGQPQHPVIRFPEDHAARMALFVAECAAHGVLLHPAGLNPSAAHTDTQVTETLRVMGKALRAVERAVERDAVPRWEAPTWTR